MDDSSKKTPAPISDEEAKAEALADTSKHAADVTRERIKHIYEQNSPNTPTPKTPE